MRALYARVIEIAPAPIPVLVQGETGTGKEWIARALHDYSAPRDRPFTVLDCGSIPNTLIDATLFGAERGAFTGAVQTSPGVFEMARGGTIFLRRNR